MPVRVIGEGEFLSSYNNYFSKKKILVTGSNGFVARNLIEKLQTLDCDIYGIDLSENINTGITFNECDLTDPEALTPLLKSIDPNLIIHSAAIVTAERDNSLFSKMLKLHCETLNIIYNALKESSQLELVVNFGSTEEYGDYDGVPFKEDMLEKSLSPYAITKTAGVHLAYMLGTNDGFSVISVRPGVLFGKCQPETKFVPYIVNQLKGNKPLELSPCEQTRDFISVDVLIDLIFQLAASGKWTPGEVFNIASGESLLLREVVELTKETLNSASEIQYGALPYRENEIMKFNVLVDKLKQRLGLPSIPSFKQTYLEYLESI